MDELILVDSNDNEIGSEEKVKCHLLPTKLHRAFSIFIFNDEGKMLIHKRSSLKDTWPGFWTNACCSHPRKGESLEEATQRRLQDELNFSCPVKYLFKFEYKAEYDEKWGEWEVDNIFIGKYNEEINPNKDEVEEIKFVDVDELKEDVKSNPDKYTPWFMKCFEKVIEYAEKNI